MEKYKLTDEHEKQLKPWADKWIANALSTRPMDENEKSICRQAVKGLYRAANLEPPPDHRIVFVSSPFIGSFAAGFAAAIWHLRKKNKQKNSDATYDAIDAATYAAIYAATDAATRDATRDATSDATEKHKSTWYVYPVAEMKKLATDLGLGDFGLSCAARSYQFWHGGNQWSGWASFLSFFRHIVKLPIDYSKWEHYEALAIHSGPRWVHEKFCIISERPEVLLVNSKNQPHCETGPFCKWRDGSALYSINGVRVPAWIVETKKEDIPARAVLEEKNAEIRREIVRKIGLEKLVRELGGNVLDSWRDYARWRHAVSMGD